MKDLSIFICPWEGPGQRETVSVMKKKRYNDWQVEISEEGKGERTQSLGRTTLG
jgi:hypothetical protein